MNEEILYKIKGLLLELYKNNSNRKWLCDLIEFSDFKFTVTHIFVGGEKAYDVLIQSEPNVFISKFDMIDEACKIIKNDLKKISNIYFQEIEIKPNYERFQIINSVFQPIFTEWDEINSLQSALINDLKKAESEVHLRNIGNSCRIILDKLTTCVFDRSKHTAPEKINLDGGNFKNRLHSYIKTELAGRSNKELRKLSENAITMAESTIDLSNNLTHNKSADRFLAEYCSVATISVISLIRMINNIN